MASLSLEILLWKVEPLCCGTSSIHSPFLKKRNKTRGPSFYPVLSMANMAGRLGNLVVSLQEEDHCFGSLLYPSFLPFSCFNNALLCCVPITGHLLLLVPFLLMPWSFGAIVGSAAGGLALLVMFAVLIWLYLFRGKGFSNKASETGSSDPSTVVEWNRTAGISSSSGALEHQGARQFSLEELEQATIKFSEHNLVGAGSFGLVYKGLLLDGTVVAIKKRERAPRQEFIEEVMILSAIRHRNLATLIGYCQDAGLQMLVFEYLPNGSICSHLFGKDQSTKLEFKQRLSIAIGAAKGLAHLHSLSPPIIHRNFKTSNVLVDENFIAKVSDAGLVKLLERFDETGPSQVSGRGIFCDTELGELGVQYETTDAYSFGAFLLELITGREVERLMVEVPSESLAQLVEALLRTDTLIDGRLGNRFTCEGMKELVVLTLQCLCSPGRRPKMEHIVRELDRILETEMTLTTVMGDGTAIVTLGSQLFT